MKSTHVSAHVRNSSFSLLCRVPLSADTTVTVPPQTGCGVTLFGAVTASAAVTSRTGTRGQLSLEAAPSNGISES